MRGTPTSAAGELLPWISAVMAGLERLQRAGETVRRLARTGGSLANTSFDVAPSAEPSDGARQRRGQHAALIRSSKGPFGTVTTT